MGLCQLQSRVHIEKSVHEIRFGTKCPENPGARGGAAAKCNFQFPHGCRIWTLAKFIEIVYNERPCRQELIFLKDVKTSLHLCLYIFAWTTFPSSTRLLHSLVLLLSMVWPMVTNSWTVLNTTNTPLLLFSINISIRGSPSFITTMNTLKNSMAGSLVRSGDIWNNAWIFLP